jgi:hypothetical protein
MTHHGVFQFPDAVVSHPFRCLDESVRLKTSSIKPKIVPCADVQQCDSWVKGMAAQTRFHDFSAFRREWVLGHLDYQRAADALESARRKVEGLSRASSAGADSDEARRAHEHVEEARRRLSNIEVLLAQQFDRFCSASR